MRYPKVRRDTHWWVRKEFLKKPLHELRSLFTVLPKFADAQPVEIFRETAEEFGIPLFYQDLSRHAEQVEDAASYGQPAEFEMRTTPRARQIPVLERFVQSIAAGRRGHLLEAPTGAGKTAMSLFMLQKLGRTALVIVPREHLLQQWIDRALELTSLTREEIGVAQQDVCDYQGKKLVVGMVHSICKDRYPEEFKRYFGVVVWDEVHTVSATTFSETVSLFPAAYRIGCSATLRRGDGTEDVFRYTIGETTLTLKGGTEVCPMVFLRSYKGQRRHPYLDKVKDAKKRRGIILSELADDLRRNVLIAVYLQKFVQSGRRALVLSDRKDQLKALKAILEGRFRMVPRDVGMFTQETKPKERERVLAHCPVILATYGVMAMGVDVPDLRALVFGTPMSDIEQPLGRILRLCDGAKEPVVLDLTDTAFPDCVRWAARRKEFYRTQAGAKIVHVDS